MQSRAPLLAAPYTFPLRNPALPTPAALQPLAPAPSTTFPTGGSVTRIAPQKGASVTATAVFPFVELANSLGGDPHQALASVGLSEEEVRRCGARISHDRLNAILYACASASRFGDSSAGATAGTSTGRSARVSSWARGATSAPWPGA